MDPLLSMRNMKGNKSIPSKAKQPPLSKPLLALKMPVSRVMTMITPSTSTTRWRTNCHRAGCTCNRLCCQCPWAGHELDARAAYQTETTSLRSKSGRCASRTLGFSQWSANFFTRPVNLERQSQAVAQSTFLKARERMLCKCIKREWHFSELGMYVTFATPRATWLYFCLFIAGYLGFLKRYLGMELQPEVILRVRLMEQYFNFLRVSGSFCSPHHKVKVWVIAQWAHTKSTYWLPLKHIKKGSHDHQDGYLFLALV